MSAAVTDALLTHDRRRPRYSTSCLRWGILGPGVGAAVSGRSPHVTQVPAGWQRENGPIGSAGSAVTLQFAKSLSMTARTLGAIPW